MPLGGGFFQLVTEPPAERRDGLKILARSAFNGRSRIHAPFLGAAPNRGKFEVMAIDTRPARELQPSAAITWISTLSSGEARRASTVARAGLLASVPTQASQTSFIAAKSPMLLR